MAKHKVYSTRKLLKTRWIKHVKPHTIDLYFYSVLIELKT